MVVHNLFSVDCMNPDPFPFIDFPFREDGTRHCISRQAYVNMICDHMAFIIISLVLFRESDRRKLQPLRVFFWLMVLNLFDYLLFYNAVWFNLFWIPVSMNTVMIVIFGYVTFKEWIGNQYSG